MARKFMVVYSIPDMVNDLDDGKIIPGERGAVFFDDSLKADQFKMDTECGFGGSAAVYKWNDINNYYCFLYE